MAACDHMYKCRDVHREGGHCILKADELGGACVWRCIWAGVAVRGIAMLLDLRATGRQCGTSSQRGKSRVSFNKSVEAQVTEVDA